MAVAYRSHSVVAYASGRTDTSITAPSGIADGDILLLAFFCGKLTTTPPSVTMPTGFTVIQGPTSVYDSFSDFYGARYLAWKLASGESGSYGTTHTSASSGALMVCVSGADSATPTSSSNSRGAGPYDT